VWYKVEEELGELQLTIDDREGEERIADEFGDVMFALINYARFLNIDPEAALERTNKKFIRRFQYIENSTDKNISELSLDEMDQLWDEAKEKEKK
jgi:XTP/dITP diphosphohydrolase